LAMTWTSNSGIFQRGPTACGPSTPMTWRPQSPRWQRRSQRTGRAARPASLWPPTPPYIRRNGTKDAMITATRLAMLPPRQTGRLPVSARSTGSGVRRPFPAPCPARGRETNALISAIAPGHLVHIVDESSLLHFLLDTGAAYSIFPHLLFWQAVRSSSHGCRWTSHSLLGRAPFFPRLP